MASGFSYPLGVAVNEERNVIVAYQYGAAKLDFADPPTLDFGSTNVGVASAKQTVTVQNIGNAALTFPSPATGNNPAVPPYFALDSSAATAGPVETASSVGSLASGASCTLSISFDPPFVSDYRAAMQLTGNALNAASPCVTQTIILLGNGVLASQTITFANPGTQTYGTPLTLTPRQAPVWRSATPR
jgi:hypothetical protein